MTCPLPEHALGLGTSEQLPTPRPVLLQGPAPRWQSPFSKAQGHGWDGGGWGGEKGKVPAASPGAAVSQQRALAV